MSLKNNIYVEFELNETADNEQILALTHTEDANVDVIELAVKQGGEPVSMSRATVTARMVLHGTRDYLINDSVACTVTNSGTILIPFDNAVIQTRSGLMKIEVNITKGIEEMTLQLPLWVSVNGSILENTELIPESQGSIPEILNDVWEELNRVSEFENGKSAYEIAVDNGFEGSEQEWLLSLKGEQGDDYILTAADKAAIAALVQIADGSVTKEKLESAYQSSLLRTKGALSDYSVNNANNVTISGVYHVDTSCSNLPYTNAIGELIVINNGNSSTRVAQLFFPYGDADTRKTIYFRGRVSGTYYNWKKITDSSEIYTKAEVNALIAAAVPAETKLNIRYSSATKYLINFGKYTMELFRTVSTAADCDNWNIGTIKCGNTVVVPTGTDIVGPIKLDGDSDFIGGVHGSSTTTAIGVYCDGVKKTLDSSLNCDCDKIVITLVDECRREAAPSEHVFDRYVTIEIERNRLHIMTTYKCVSSNVNVKVATNGGLIAVRNNILNGLSMNNTILNEAPATTLSNSSHKNTRCVMNLSMGTLIMTNIKGQESEDYYGQTIVYTNETPMRTKVYFYLFYCPGSTYKTFQSGNLISGEFEYLFT